MFLIVITDLCSSRDDVFAGLLLPLIHLLEVLLCRLFRIEANAFGILGFVGESELALVFLLVERVQPGLVDREQLRVIPLETFFIGHLDGGARQSQCICILDLINILFFHLLFDRTDFWLLY